MTIPSYVEDVDVSNLEAAIVTLIVSIKELQGIVEEATAELRKIKTGTGLSISTDLDEGAE